MKPSMESEVAARIFRVRRLASGYYEVRDDYGSLLGTTGDEARELHVAFKASGGGSVSRTAAVTFKSTKQHG